MKPEHWLRMSRAGTPGMPSLRVQEAAVAREHVVAARGVAKTMASMSVGFQPARSSARCVAASARSLFPCARRDPVPLLDAGALR